LFRLWITACYRTADILVTPTKYSATLLSRYRQLRVPIVPVSNGIDLEEFYPDPQAGRRFREEYGFSPEQKVVLGIGHYIERKGILDFIELAKKMPEYAFVWFGFTDAYLLPAPVRHALKNAPDNLLFPGYVQRSKIREAYCGADVFVFPTYEETEGLALLEAMASQIPVIVRDIPIYAHWVKDKTDVYKCKSLPEFEDTLRGILHGKLPDLTAQARETVRQRSIDHSARELLKVYRALLIGRRRKSVQDKASAKSGKKGKFNWG
jgi:1,2-diacylglycerol-3-alpha-glucose alpha-1,2-glucosyltransferase